LPAVLRGLLTWRNRYSEILDYHNVDANVTQMEDQFNGQ
jgi:hypothetical protein